MKKSAIKRKRRASNLHVGKEDAYIVLRAAKNGGATVEGGVPAGPIERNDVIDWNAPAGLAYLLMYLLSEPVWAEVAPMLVRKFGEAMDRMDREDQGVVWN